MKIEFECTQCFDDSHNKKFTISQIVNEYPMHCGYSMIPVDPISWNRIAKAISNMNMIAIRELDMTLDDVIRGN